VEHTPDIYALAIALLVILGVLVVMVAMWAKIEGPWRRAKKPGKPGKTLTYLVLEAAQIANSLGSVRGSVLGRYGWLNVLVSRPYLYVNKTEIWNGSLSPLRTKDLDQRLSWHIRQGHLLKVGPKDIEIDTGSYSIATEELCKQSWARQFNLRDRDLSVLIVEKDYLRCRGADNALRLTQPLKMSLKVLFLNNIMRVWRPAPLIGPGVVNTRGVGGLVTARTGTGTTPRVVNAAEVLNNMNTIPNESGYESELRTQLIAEILAHRNSGLATAARRMALNHPNSEIAQALRDEIESLRVGLRGDTVASGMQEAETLPDDVPYLGTTTDATLETMYRRIFLTDEDDSESQEELDILRESTIRMVIKFPDTRIAQTIFSLARSYPEAKFAIALHAHTSPPPEEPGLSMHDRLRRGEL
jgi:hypothetical protein